MDADVYGAQVLVVQEKTLAGVVEQKSLVGAVEELLTLAGAEAE
jgi:hypothetical protein